MTPPQAIPPGTSADGTAPAAVSLRVDTLTRRSDFLRAARAARVSMPGFILQARKRGAEEPAGLRLGITCSKKVGNAVARNRAKRRLREVARLSLPGIGQDGVDYVLIGRAGATAEMPFARLRADFETAVGRLRHKLQ